MSNHGSSAVRRSRLFHFSGTIFHFSGMIREGLLASATAPATSQCCRNPLCLILRQQLRRRPPPWLIFVINVRKLLSVSVAHDVVVRLEFGGPGRWEATRVCHTHFLELAAPSHFPDNFTGKRRAVIWRVLLSSRG